MMKQRRLCWKCTQKHWIAKGWSFVNTILHPCTLCHRYEGKACIAQIPPTLPKFQVREEPPLPLPSLVWISVVLLMSRQILTKVRSSSAFTLYTGCFVQAIHLDTVPDLTTESFLRSFKEFSAWRGLPLKMIPDYGKTFMAAPKSPEKMMNHEEVQWQ